MADQNQTCYLKSPPWTDFEQNFKSFLSSQCDSEKFHLREAIQQRMQDSSLGSFLYNLNRSQQQQTYIQQDKLERIRFDIGKGLVNMKELGRFNDICEDVLGLIELCLRNSSTGKITLKKVLGNLNLLRLTGSRITTMDDSLCKLRNLEALVLAGNCLNSCSSSSLPRGLIILELFCNRLDDIFSLADDPPPHLLYLGLARNYLTSGVLESLKNFQFLYHLDLAHNNIQDISRLALECSQLENLTSLMLIGNPCSMSPNYSTFVLENIPKLIFLDGEKLKKEINSSKAEEGSEQLLLGTLQICLYRVMGLPQPTNEKINKKKVTHSFRLEMESSLLQIYLPSREASFIIRESLVQNEEEVKKEPEKKGGKPKNNKKSKDGSSKSKKNKKQTVNSDLADGKKKKKSSEGTKITGDKEDLDSKENQEALMYKVLLKTDQTTPQQSFKSERKNWGKIVQFSEPTIEVSNCNLWSLRDVFKTNLTLRIVHLKTLPPISKVKNKPKKQEKTKPSDTPSNKADGNKEILVSKSTLAIIKIPLQDILWNKKYLDYSWTKTKPFKVEQTTGLKDLCYVIKKKKEPKNKKGNIEGGTRELQIPKDLTCHIGVGVKREESNGVTQEI